ncbi:hypothetical protein AAKU55_000644 [Oxalobacteraceae bacterium GrIS 1.11]
MVQKIGYKNRPSKSTPRLPFGPVCVTIRADGRGALPFIINGNTMKFEHLIEINDPLNPLIEPISQEQLWRGLVLRAESPKLFVPHLDDCQIEQRDEAGFRRRLRYGELVIEDRVRLLPLHQVRYEVAAQKDISPSSLVMTIEMPSPDTLWVRFQYDDGHDAATDAANAMYDDFRRSAYQESDIDTIRILRELAEQGRLDALLN